MRLLKIATPLLLLLAAVAGGAPSITQQPQLQSIESGGNAVLSVTASGATSYQWYTGTSGDITSPVPGATGPLCVTLPLRSSGSYWVSVSDAGGSTSSNAAAVTVTAPPPGILMGMGSNSYGQIGDLTTDQRPIPRAIADDVRTTSGNGRHTLFIKGNGQLWALGYGGYGQLGDGSYTIRIAPALINDDAVQAAAGDAHSLFLRSDGTAWATGYNSYGQLGTGNTSERNTPLQVMSDVVQVAAGESHSHFLKADGTLWSTGYNSKGQLGDGTNITRTSPVQVATGVAAISSSTRHGLILKTDGSLWAMGENANGQLGDGSSTNRWSPVPIATGVSYVSAGVSHSIFRKTDGTWWAMGENTGGTLGDGTATERRSPVSLGSGIRSASAGADASLWVKDDGLIWAMGSNSKGQAGNGTLDVLYPGSPRLTANRAVKVVAAPEFALFIDASPHFATEPPDQVILPGTQAHLSVAQAIGADVTYQWYRGERGDTSQPASPDTPPLTQDTSYWVRISNAYGSSDSRTVRVIIASQPVIQTAPVSQAADAGESRTLSVVASGGGLSYQWYSGLPGDTSSPFVGATGSLFVVPPLYATQSFWVRASNPAGTADSPAATVTVAPVLVAALRAAGSNSSRQLNTGDSLTYSTPQLASPEVIGFDAGRYRSLFIKPDHTLWAAGDGASTAQQIATNVAAVSAGEDHVLLLKSDASLWAVGGNDFGQLGDGTISSRSTPVQMASGVARISAGGYFSLFVKTDGSLWACGGNSYGQFGNGSFDDSLSPVLITTGVIDAAAGYDHASFLKADGTLWSMGDNSSYPIGDGSSTPRRPSPVLIASGVTKISANNDHTLFLKSDGSLWTTAALIGSDRLPFQIATQVAKIAAGARYDLFIKTDGSLWGKGENTYGQLGNGSPTYMVPDPIPITGGVLAVSGGGSHSLFSDRKPAITTHPLTAFVVSGTSTQLTVAAGGEGPLTYQWYTGESGDTTQPIAGEQTTTYTTPVLTADARYWVRVTNPYGTWDSRTALLTVVLPPQITKAPVNPAPVAYGGNAFMSVTVGGPGLTYQWYSGTPGDTSVPITGAKSPFFVTPPLSSGGSYWVRATNAAGTVDSAAVQVSMAPSYPSVMRVAGANTKGQLGLGTTTAVVSPFTDTARPAVDIAAGLEHSLYLEEDGTLLAMGGNSYGQLGDKTTTTRPTPVVIAEDVTRVAAGRYHSLFLKRDGTLWSMGSGYDGQTGFPIYSNPIPRQAATGVVQISAGEAHSLFLKMDGTLWAMGSNVYGQTGTGYSFPFYNFYQVASGVVKIAAGNAHSLFLKSDGTVWATGLNASGQLGDGSTTNRLAPVQVAADLPGGIRVTDIAGGGRHSLLIRSNGTVWGCGANNYGQLGLGGTASSSTWVQLSVTSPTAIAGGMDHSFILRGDGTLWAAGRNDTAQLGSPGGSNRTSFFQAAAGITRMTAGVAHSLILAAPPQIVSQPLEVGALTGQTPELAVTAAGLPSISYKWYLGESGNASQPIAGATFASYVTPPFAGAASYWVKVTGPAGFMNSQTIRVLPATPPAITLQPQPLVGLLGMPAQLSVAAGGGVLSYQWYYGSSGDTSSPVPGGTSARLETPALTTGLSVWVRITNAAGTVDSQAATVTAAEGQLVTLGSKTDGQLGDGSVFEYPLPVQIGSQVRKVWATDSAALLLKQDGTLWGAGQNFLGSLGDTTRDTQSGFVQLASDVEDVQGGFYFTIFLKTDGTLWVMGYIQVADDDYQYYHEEPVQIASGVTKMSGGWRHYVYLTTDGTLWGAGDNFWGPLGTGTRDNHYTPIMIATGVIDASAGDKTTLFVKADGSLWGSGWNSGTIGNGDSSTVLTPVQAATGVARVFTSASHTLFIKQDGSLWGTGSNSSGQLGDGTTSYRTSPVSITGGVQTAAPGGNQSLIIKTDGSLWAMGRNLRGELGDGTYTNSSIPLPLGRSATSISAASGYSLFVDTEGRAWAMGVNSDAQFGFDIPTFRDTPAYLSSPVSQVSARYSTSLFIRADGSLWGMGGNSSSQLGDGSTRYRYTPVPIATGVKKAAAGASHSLFIKSDDSLWGMGNGTSRQLGNRGSSKVPVRIESDVRDIAAGSSFSLFVKKNGTLWGMGTNSDHQLGQPGTANVAVPVMIASGVARVSAGSYHSLFLKTDGTLWTIGSNEDGQTGGPDTNDTLTPRQLAAGVIDFAAGDSHTVYVTADGTLWGLGSSSSSQLGLSLSYPYQVFTPRAISTGVARVWAGSSSTLFLKTDGTLWGVGSNNSGSFGDTTEDYSPIRRIASGVASAAAGSAHSLIIAIGPVITAQPESVTVASGSPADFAVAATGSGLLSYQWYRGESGDTSQPLAAATSPQLSAAPATVPMNYWVRVSNSYTHTDSRTVVHAIADGGSAPYQSWAAGKGLTDLSPAADPDHDGLSNYLEYFFNTNPLSASGAQGPVGAVTPGALPALTLTFRHLRNSKVDYTPQWSLDLSDWDPSWYDSEILDPDVDGDGRTELIRIKRQIDPAESKGFLRLDLEEP